jgi:hypothetical protein
MEFHVMTVIRRQLMILVSRVAVWGYTNSDMKTLKTKNELEYIEISNAQSSIKIALQGGE